MNAAEGTTAASMSTKQNPARSRARETVIPADWSLEPARLDRVDERRRQVPYTLPRKTRQNSFCCMFDQIKIQFQFQFNLLSTKIQKSL